MERTYGRHIRSRISQPTIWQGRHGVWVLDRAFGPNEYVWRSGNRHNRLAAIRRSRMNHCFFCGRHDTTERGDAHGRPYWVCTKHQDAQIRDVQHYWDGFLGVNGNTNVPGCML